MSDEFIFLEGNEMRKKNDGLSIINNDVALCVSMPTISNVFLNSKALIRQVANNDFAGVAMSFLLIKKYQNQQVEFINVEGLLGYTALMHAVLKSVDMLKFFLDKVDDCLAPDDALQVIEYKCSANVTALMLAQGLGNPELIKVIEDAIKKLNAAKNTIKQSDEQEKPWVDIIEEQKINSQIKR